MDLFRMPQITPEVACCYATRKQILLVVTLDWGEHFLIHWFNRILIPSVCQEN